MALIDKLTDIADAIRSKTGGTALLALDAMPAAIRSINGTSTDNTLLNSIIDRSITTITANDLKDVTIIGESAFADCQRLTSATIGGNIEVIENRAFSKCTKLKTVVIQQGVTKIDLEAFYNCYNLESITIPSSVTLIQLDAFSGCSKLANVYYKGTEAEWNAISISSGNDYLKNATIHYNS